MNKKLEYLLTIEDAAGDDPESCKLTLTLAGPLKKAWARSGSQQRTVTAELVPMLNQLKASLAYDVEGYL